MTFKLWISLFLTFTSQKLLKNFGFSLAYLKTIRLSLLLVGIHADPSHPMAAEVEHSDQVHDVPQVVRMDDVRWTVGHSCQKIPGSLVVHRVHHRIRAAHYAAHDGLRQT